MSDNFCLPAPCPVVLSSTCVFYEGENLVYIGVNTGDSLEVALQKINGKIQDTAFGYIFRNGIEQPIPGGPVVLGGSLIQNTTITGAYNVNFTQANLGAVKFVTAGGTSSQYVKGDGSLDSTSLQPAGNYITGLTGDGTASGPGSVTFTLSTVNNNPGTYGSSTSIPQITVDAKGRVTTVTPVTVYIPSGSLSFTGDVSGSGNTGSTTTLTLNTVNSNVYTNNTFLKFTVNGKGLVTAATPVVSGDIETVLGYTPVTNARTITINGVTYDLTANRSWSVGTVTSVGVSAGAGISASVLNPNDTPVISITNTAPDQIVALTAGDGINITGTYPNFTVSNSASYMSLQGDWNAATNTPNLTSGPITTGYAWRVSVDGNTDLGGITDWKVGDLAVKSATGWIKIDNSDTITSVFGRVGAIVAQTGDYNTDLVTEAINNLYFTTSRARQAISGSGPINYSTTTGIISINQSSGTSDGYLSSSDWSTFYNKESAISPGITTQYWRGDKTWQILDTSVVPENTNQYFTTSRARQSVSLTTTGSSGASTYDNITGIFNVPNYTLAGLGGVPTTRTLTINGTTYDLSADRTWTLTGFMPAGGTAGQILAKIDGTDYNTEWIDNYATQVKNVVKLGATLSKGTPVYITSADGTNIIVNAAGNQSEATSSKTFGLLETGGVLNDQVKVVTYGLISGLDTSMANAGDPVWLGPNGTLLYGLANKPYAPAHMVYIGAVSRVQQNNGEIFVNVQNGFEMDEIHNVSAQNPANNAILAYSTSTSLWEKNTIAGVLGYTPVPTTRTLTINGTAYDLSADRSWTISTGISGSGTTNYLSKWTGSTSLGNSIVYDNGSAVGINTASPFESAAFKLDVNGGVLIKNTSGTSAQLVLIDSNPATGGNNGFVQLTAGGNTGTAYGQWQTYYGTSIASGVLRLQPAGGNVLIGSTTAVTGAGMLQVVGDVNITGAFKVNGVAISSGGVTSFNTRTGAVTLSSSDVTTALGYTPYSSANPNGYITSSASITGTSDGVSTSVAAGSEKNLLYSQMADNDFFRIRVGGASNAGWAEIATADDGNEPIYVRQYTGVFSSLTRTATLLDGSGNTSFPGTVTAPTFSGALSGNASTATTATNSSQLNGISSTQIFNNMGQNHGTYQNFNSVGDFGVRYMQGSTNGPQSGQFYGFTLGLGNDYSISQYASQFYWMRNTTNPYIWIRYEEGGSWGSWTKVSAGYADSAGSASTAGNVSSISSAVGGSYTWTGIQYFQTNNGGSAVNNSNTAALEAYSTGNNSAFMSFHKGGYYAINMGLDGDNVFRIGGWSAGANRLQMDMSGNLTMAGDVTAYSDARVKTNVKTIDKALEKVLALRGVSYIRTDSNDVRTKIGVIAQETLPIVPEVVNQDNDGMYNVSYGNFAGLFIEAFKEQQVKIDKQDKVIEELKQTIHDLTK